LEGERDSFVEGPVGALLAGCGQEVGVEGAVEVVFCLVDCGVDEVGEVAVVSSVVGANGCDQLCAGGRVGRRERSGEGSEQEALPCWLVEPACRVEALVEDSLGIEGRRFVEVDEAKER
jgi:hypothetical protein